MKRLLFLFSAAFLADKMVAQSQRVILVEEFTQASCGPCASANPAFNSLLSANTAKVVSLKYQTDWPGVDPMNAQNKSDVAKRVAYYAASTVPTAQMDGNVVAGTPGTITQTNIDAQYAVASPFSIDLKHWFNTANDSVFINCTVNCTQNVTLTNPKIRIALLEKTIKFTSAPGTNGETEFYNVMRKMYPNGDGSNMTKSWTAGQKFVISFSGKIPTYIYSKPQLATIAWVQDDGNKNVLQAGYSPTASTALALPPLADFSADVLTSCDGNIRFTDNSALFPSKWTWDFGDGTTSSLKDPIHHYTANGTYTVKLTAQNPNGTNQNTKTAFINVNLTGTAPVGVNDNICHSGIAYLSATASGSGTLNWYDQSGALVHTGNTYSPNITGTTNFYVSEMTANAQVSAGPLDNTIGAGDYYTANNSHGLYFDVASSSVINTVKIYAKTAGSRTIEVFDKYGVSVQTANVNLSAGLNTVTLNFAVKAGTGYLMKVTSATVDLYRNSAGAAFPYTTSAITITGNTAPGAPSFYYYFYDWKVTPDPCASPAALVKGIDSCASVGIANNFVSANGISLSPNPSQGKITLGFNAETNDNYIITISNTVGQIIFQEKLNNFNGYYTRLLDLVNYPKGIYFVNVTDGHSRTSKKILLE